MKTLYQYTLMPLWKVWFILCFSIPFLILYPLFYVAFITKQLRFAYALKKVWAFLIVLFAGIIPVIKYKKKFKWPHKCVVVSNHTSYL
ncbi:MAG TPA: hypothetical protein PLC65_20860, partial [Bacteroidia bacterium]|nr:hypothetical protein [Bacteroidia bacterium]